MAQCSLFDRADRLFSRLDIVVLNAGVALTQKYMTEDGFELHMAANHLGHFLLTNLLLPLLCKTAAENYRRQMSVSDSRNRYNGQLANGDSQSKMKDPVRIVVLSSLGHVWANLELDNLNSEKYYDVSNKRCCFHSQS